MEASVSGKAVVRFGVFEVDLFSRELFKRGHRIKLQDQPFQILAILLERPGQLVTREQLRQRLWHDETVVSFDDGLNAAIRRLRFALGDSAGRSKYIETLPRRGYRFVAEVNHSVVFGDPPPAPRPPAQSESGPSPEANLAAVHQIGVKRRVPTWMTSGATPVIVLSGIVILSVVIATTLGSRPKASATTTPKREATFVHVTTAPGVELNPTLSPDGLSVAYVAHCDGDLDILVQPVGTGESATNLTMDSTVDDRQPAFSPDGQLIAFRSEREGGGIFLMSAKGGAVRRLIGFGFDPTWSPDGKFIAIASEGVVNPLSRTTWKSSIDVVNVATGERRRLFDGDAVQPSWSPHGHRIAFWRITGAGGRRDLATVSTSGGDAVAATSDAAIDWGPVWSPDGKHLFFSSDRGGTMNLWRIAIDEQSGRPRGIPEAITTPARWSGDVAVAARGDQIAFSAADPRSNIKRIGFDPRREAVTGDPVPVTGGTLSFMQPAVSPDGQWVVYRTEAEQEDLYVSRADGTEQRKLTDDPANDRAPAWSPDGKRIAFYSDRGGKYEGWAVHPDGSGLAPLTKSPAHPMFFPLWVAGERRIVVNNAEGTFTADLGREPASVFHPLPRYSEEGRVFRASSITPDGQWLAGTIYSVEGARVPGVVVYSMKERKYRRLTTIGSWPTWLSDGQRLMFSERDKLYVVNRVTGASRVIYTVEGQIPPGVALTPDDRQIFFAHADQESDIWIRK